MKARRHPTSVRRPPEERGGTGEKCVAVRLAERLAAVSGGTYLESHGLFPGRAAVKTATQRNQHMPFTALTSP